MTTFYYCNECDETMTDADTATDVEHVTSEFWGARSTQAMHYVVCGCCGGDVEEVPDPDETNEEDEDEPEHA